MSAQTCPATVLSDKALLEGLDTVVDELASVIAEENAILSQPGRPSVESVARRKMALIGRYQALVAEFRARAARLHREGAFDAEGLAKRIRHLLSMLRDNQRRLSSRKRVAMDRIQAVMEAVGDCDQRTATYDSCGRRGSGGSVSVSLNSRV